MPMPLDVAVTYSNGTTEMFYIALDILRGAKPNENPKQKRTVLPRWQWTNATYDFEISADKGKVLKVEIDPSKRMADVKLENNIWNGAKN